MEDYMNKLIIDQIYFNMPLQEPQDGALSKTPILKQISWRQC